MLHPAATPALQIIKHIFDYWKYFRPSLKSYIAQVTIQQQPIEYKMVIMQENEVSGRYIHPAIGSGCHLCLSCQRDTKSFGLHLGN